MNEAEDLPFVAASERNREPILAALADRLPTSGYLLEIASGTGQHAVFMAPRLPGIRWLPSELPERLAMLKQRLYAQPSENLLSAIALDVRTNDWPDVTFDAAYAANIAHIMSWTAVLAVFRGLEKCMANQACFFLYGPFNVDGRYTSDGNRGFDHSLRANDPEMGIRDLEQLETAAAGHNFELQERLSMPANNLLLVFRHQTE